MKHKFLPNVKIMAALVAGLLLSVAMMQDVNAETFGDYTYTLINGDEIEITHAKGVELTDNRSWWDDEVALADPAAPS